MLTLRVLDDDDLEACQHELRIDFTLGYERVVRSRARTVELEHLAEQFLQVGLANARAEEEQRSLAKHLGERPAEVQLAIGDTPVLVVPDHQLIDQIRTRLERPGPCTVDRGSPAAPTTALGPPTSSELRTRWQSSGFRPTTAKSRDSGRSLNAAV